MVCGRGLFKRWLSKYGASITMDRRFNDGNYGSSYALFNHSLAFLEGLYFITKSNDYGFPQKHTNSKARKVWKNLRLKCHWL